jgi:O-antigen/teichoic acid export membrane protein
VPVYVTHLTIQEYGEYALAQTLVWILPTVLSLGLPSAVARFFFDAPTPRDSRECVGSAAAWTVLLTVTGALLLQVVLLLAWPSGRDGIAGRWELSCIIWAAAGAAITAVPTVYLRAAQRATAAAAFQLSHFLATVVSGLLLVVWLERGLRGAIEAFVLAHTFSGAAALIFIFGFLHARLKLEVLQRALRFSLPLAAHYTADQLQQISDRWSLKVAGLQTALGVYSLAGQLTAPVFMAVFAWHEAATPKMGEKVRRGGVPALLRELPGLQRSYMLASLLPSLAVVLALPIVISLTATEYMQLVWLVPLLLAATVIDALYFPSLNVLIYANRTGRIPLITFSTCLISLVLNVFLVFHFGIRGAVAARLLSAMYRSGVMWFASRRWLPPSIEYSMSRSREEYPEPVSP